MTKKYYLRIEIRYTYYIKTDVPEELDPNYTSKYMNSDTFDTEQECINLGNNLISSNSWAEQYPGMIGNRLKRRLGRPIVVLSLKNGAEIFITVESLNVMDYEELNSELIKFNINRITSKI